MATIAAPSSSASSSSSLPHPRAAPPPRARPARPMPAFLRRIRAAHHADDEEDEEQAPASTAAAHEASEAGSSSAGANGASPPGDGMSQSQQLPLPPQPPPASSRSGAGAGTSAADDDPTLVPPDNFAMVSSFVYRSSFPKKKHFAFLKTLGLRSVLTLILEEYPEQNMRFLDDEGIKFFQFGIPGNKEPFVQIPEDMITAALVTILDKRNHPMLIHCNKGKHRTGCLIGCLRKLQQWSLTTIFDEYRRFSAPKSRSMDQEFIELYAEQRVWAAVRAQQRSAWLPRWEVLAKRSTRLMEREEEEEGPTHGL